MIDKLECDSINTLGKGIIVETKTEKMVYSVEDIQMMLALGRNSTYAFLDKVYKEQRPFKVLKIGKIIRVPKTSFDDWLTGKGEK